MNPILILLMATSFFLSSGLSAQLEPTPNKDYCEFKPDPQSANGLHIVFLAGDEEYRSEEAFPMLAKIMAKHHGFHCDVLFPINPQSCEIDPNDQVNIPRMDLIDKADLVVMGWRFRHPSDDSMQWFLKYLKAGKPIIGFRTSTHAFAFPDSAAKDLRQLNWNSKDWPGGFGKHVFGETWVSHHGDHGSQSTRGLIVPESKSHPIVKGVTDIWGPTDVYGVNSLPDDAVVLVRGQVLSGMLPTDEPVTGKQNEPLMPLIWAREFAVYSESPKGRYVCSTIGAAEDFQSEGLRRLFVNACFWSVRKEGMIRDDMTVDIVGNFKPTKFGFNAFQAGRKPKDYQ